MVSFCEENTVNITGDNGLGKFMTALLDVLRRTGIRFEEGPQMYYADFHMAPHQAIDQGIRLAQQHFNRDPKIIMVLLPNNGEWRSCSCAYKFSRSPLKNVTWCTLGSVSLKSCMEAEGEPK